VKNYEKLLGWMGVVGFGIGVGLTSLYQLSMEANIRKMGLWGQDWERVVMEPIKIEVREECGWGRRWVGVVKYRLDLFEKRERGALEMGRERVGCGAAGLSKGKVQEGFYEIMKGLKYLQEGLQMVKEEENCERQEELGEERRIMDEVLGKVSGRVKDLLAEEWGRVEVLETQVKRECLD